MKQHCALSVQQLSFCYGKRTALDDINFELTPASFNGLLGSNGAGKTTLFAILTRLLAARQGDIKILGLDLQKQAGLALANMGVVFQQSTLDTDLTVAQNLHYHAALHGMRRKLARERISEQLQRFEMQDRQHDRIRSLNQGHRRRVEFARALLHHPRLLLLDEATVGLDVETRDMINRHVRDLCLQHSVTVLWATHLVDDITLDDHVLLLRQGKLVAQGSCEQLLAQHHYDSLHQMMLHQSDQAG